jgi:hypothetical protein
MSTINKILKTVGVAAVCDVIVEVAVGLAENDLDVKKFAGNFDAEDFVEDFANNFASSTLPALVVFGIDKLVNQNITSNKTIQYGLTAAEGVLAYPTGLSVFETNVFPKYFGDLSSPSFKDIPGNIKIIAANTMAQSLAFKYIWDSRDETTELDQTVD